MGEGKWAPEFGFYKDTDSPNKKCLFLSNKSFFLFVTSKKWSDTEIGLALAWKFLMFIPNSLNSDITFSYSIEMKDYML